MPKVVLINLNSPWANQPAMNPNLGLCYLSAHLKDAGLDNLIGIDLALPDKTLSDIPLNADYYAISCMTPQYHELITVCTYLRHSKGQVMIGGPHITAIPEDIPYIEDIGIRGDGEKALVEYIRDGKHPGNGIHRCDKRHDLIPDRNVFGPLSQYHRKLNGEPAAHIVTLRGCPYRCSYCDTTSTPKKVMYRDLDKVFGEISFIRTNYDIHSFIIYDDIFTLNRARITDFCLRAVVAGIKFRIWARADKLDREILTNLKWAGMTQVTIGIESGSNKILKNINKQCSAEENYSALMLCKDLNIPVRCSLMFGNPGEDVGTIQETIELVQNTQPDEWNLAVLQPIPGSDVWNNPEKHNLKFDKKLLKEREYVQLNRFAGTGIGEIWYDYANGDKKAMKVLLKYFVKELERVCPRKQIQDTIQNINLKGEHHESVSNIAYND